MATSDLSAGKQAIVSRFPTHENRCPTGWSARLVLVQAEYSLRTA